MNRFRPSLLFTMMMIWAPIAAAGPGALEISETCAVHTGCFIGDTAGYPVTIDPTTPGSSFVLTSDLNLPDANTHGIEITKPHVRIDLGGFTVRGVTTCTGDPNVCTNTGTGMGVRATTVAGVEVANGAVTGAGSTCVHLHLESRIEDVRADQCGGTGLHVSQRGAIIDSIANRAGFIGIANGIAGVISNSTASFTDGTGILLGNGSTITGSAAYKSTGVGISVGYGSTAENCAAYENGEEGFRTSGAAVVRGSGAYLNADAGIQIRFAGGTAVGNSVSNNGDGESTDHGIHCETVGCNIQDNTIRDNDGWGIFATDATTGYGSNVTGGNTQGAVSGGTDLGGNLLN